MKPLARSARVAVLFAALFLSLASALAADEAAIKAEIEAVRKATIERYKDRLPDNFETYVRDTGTRNYHQRQFTTALTNGNATALAVVFKEFPEFARPQFLNGYAVQGKSALLYAVERGHREVVELLLAQKVGADAPRPVSSSPFGSPFGPSGYSSGYQERRDTPLHAAVRAGNLELTKLLLDAGANLEAMDQRSESPLYICVRLLGSPGFSSYGTLPADSEARTRQAELVTLLLKRGAQVLSTNRYYTPYQPLNTVLQQRNEAMLDQFLTNSIHLTATNGTGDTLTHLAVAHGRTNALRALLAKQPPLAAVNASGFTPLRQAAWLPVVAQMPSPSYYGGNSMVDSGSRAGFLRQRLADLLLAAGASPDVFVFAGLNRTNELAALLRRDASQASALDPQGRNPLHYAVNAGSTAALQLLFAAKADTEARDKSGLTPLLQALGQRRFAEATQLLAVGAKAAITNAAGQTALHYAVSTGGDTNLAAALVTAGADVNARDAAGKTPLELAAIQQRFELVTWFETRGAIAAPRAARLMTTPLHQAVSHGNMRQVLTLLTNGADVNARNEHGNSPFALAVSNGRVDLVLLLLTNGANVNLADTNGTTPLRARFLAASDPVPDPVPKPGFSKLAPAFKAAKSTATRADSLPPELRPSSLPGHPPLNNLLLLLLENGADPKIPDLKGNSLLHALQPPARDYESPPRPKTTLIPEAVARIQLLANYGLPPDSRATNGQTPLHAMVAQANLVQTFALLEAGAGVNLADREGRTALHHILTPKLNPYQWQHEQSVRDNLARTLAVLLDNGADLRRADTNGAIPLHLLPAMDERLRDLVFPVLKTNRHFAAALRVKNKAGQTPVLLAFEQLRKQPVAPVAKLFTTLFDSGGGLPMDAVPGGTTLLHELAGLGVSGTPARGMTQPDATTAEVIARIAAKLMTIGAKVDGRDTAGETPLHRATRNHNAAFAAMLLAHGANPNALNPQGDTPLHLALRELIADHSHPVIPVLARHQADFGRRNIAGETPLRLESTRRYNRAPLFLPPGATQGFMAAVQAGDLASVNAYLTVDPAMATASSPLYEHSAVRAAALAGHREVAERLRDAGAVDPVSAAVLGWTNSLAAFVHASPQLGENNLYFSLPLLHLAASRGQLASVRMLLTPQVAPGAEDVSGRTAYYYATTNGNPELLALLAARGVRRSVFDALWLADTNLLTALLTADPARAHATNRAFESALLIATERGNAEIVRRLLAHGADPNRAVAPTNGLFSHRFIAGTVPLHLAAWSNRTNLAEILVAAKANLAPANQRGYAALHFAAAQGNHEMATWLLARGADLNVKTGTTVTNSPGRFPTSFQQQSNLGWTPLHLAVRHGHPTLIELLVAKGAKLEITNALGRTPADLTQQSSWTMSSPWPPSPYLNLAPGMPAPDMVRDPARAQAVVEVLKKLGAVIPTARGASFFNSARPSSPPPSVTPPSAAPPAKK